MKFFPLDILRHHILAIQKLAKERIFVEYCGGEGSLLEVVSRRHQISGSHGGKRYHKFYEELKQKALDALE